MDKDEMLESFHEQKAKLMPLPNNIKPTMGKSMLGKIENAESVSKSIKGGLPKLDKEEIKAIKDKKTKAVKEGEIIKK